jgi:hypothetical protein
MAPDLPDGSCGFLLRPWVPGPPNSVDGPGEHRYVQVAAKRPSGAGAPLRRPRGRKAAAKPKRAAVRGAQAAHGGSGRACHAAKVLPRHYPIQQEKFSVLYSCQRFKGFLGRAAMKGRPGVREHPFDGWAVGFSPRRVFDLTHRAAIAPQRRDNAWARQVGSKTRRGERPAARSRVVVLVKLTYAGDPGPGDPRDGPGNVGEVNAKVNLRVLEYPQAHAEIAARLPFSDTGVYYHVRCTAHRCIYGGTSCVTGGHA